MSKVLPWTHPIRIRASPGSRAGSDIARSFLARLRSTGSRIEDCARRKFIEKLVIIDDVHPLRKLRSKRVTLRPHRLGGKRIVIARHQEDRRMSAALIAKRHGQPLPEILGRSRVVEQVAGA